MTTTKTKTNRLLLFLSIVILFQPNLHIIDILPDFIAFFMIAKVLERPADLSPYFEEARSAFMKLAWLDLCKLPALVLAVQIGGGIMTDTMALFALCFGVGDAILGFLAVRHLFEAIFYLGQRSNAPELLSDFHLSKTRRLTPDAYRAFTYLFLLVKYAVAMLPEFLLLTQGKSIDAEAFAGVAFYPITVLLAQSIGLALGIVWLVRSVRYLKHTVSSGAFDMALGETMDSHRTALFEAKFRMRAICNALTVLSVASVFTFLLRVDSTGGAPILPSVLFPAVFLFGIVMLRKYLKNKVALICVGLIATTCSLVCTVFTNTFFAEYTLGQMLVQEQIRALYAPVVRLCVFECIAVALLLILFTVSMRSFLQENTGVSPSSDRYRETDRAYHRALGRKSVVFTGLGILLCVTRALDAIFYGMPKSVLTHDPNEFGNSAIVSPAVEWFGVVTLATSVIFLLYSFYFFSLLKEEVKMKLEMEG